MSPGQERGAASAAPAASELEHLEQDERAAYAQFRAVVGTDTAVAIAFEAWLTAKRRLANAHLELGAEAAQQPNLDIRTARLTVGRERSARERGER